MAESIAPESSLSLYNSNDAVQVEEKIVYTAERRMSNSFRERRGSGSTGSGSDSDLILERARAAIQDEQAMSLWVAIKSYPRAIGWSVLASTCIIMEGYDLSVVFSFFAFPSFQTQYGHEQPDGSYQISAPWQTGLTNGACIGEMIGLALTGIFADRYGQRAVIIGALLLITCFVFVTFFSPNLPILLLGQILCGIPWGAFQTITPSYAAEVVPIALRAYLTCYVNLCWVMGQIIGSGVLRALVDRTDEWGYRIPFAVQWIWPAPLIIGMYLAPESPWWLVRKGCINQAEESVKRLMSKGEEGQVEIDSKKAVAAMIHTNALEMEITAGTSYLDCFRGIELRRTEICCMVWMNQILCGGGIMAYSSYFFERAGLDTAYSFDLTMAQYGLGAIGVFIAWGLMPWVGRRKLFIVGQVLLMMILVVVGLIGLGPRSETLSWAVGALLLVYVFIYDITVGPLCYSLVSEISSTRLRQKTLVIARNAYLVANIINNILTPQMLNPTAWDWGPKTGLFWAGIGFLTIVWSYYRLPEPKDRSYAEMDALFERKVPARKFATTKVNPFDNGRSSRHGSVVVAGGQEEKVKGT